MSHDTQNDDLRPDYDFSGAVQGKHHKAYRTGNHAILLEPDVAAVFGDSNAVNAALRMLIKIAAAQVHDHPREHSS